ncbi:MAG: Fic family protein, partial [Myxococcota bacterium]
MWTPTYEITPKTAKLLMAIEAAKADVEHLVISPAVETELRRQARLRSTHYSTRIEGNKLTLAEASMVVGNTKVSFRGRERDVGEVRNYWNALVKVEDRAKAFKPVSEELIKKLHALVEHGPRAKPTPYRDGQNVIRDAASGAMVYLPPEAKDVPKLMATFVRWLVKADKLGVPVPLVAGLAHYQFVTVHPYYDGNGRTARLLATFLLHRGGYGLNGFLSLEEYHAKDLASYYRALAVHPHHNYYEGRAEADLTSWVDYFVATLAETFAVVRTEAKRLARGKTQAVPDPLRKLDHRARTVLGLFGEVERIGTGDVARVLGLSERMVRVLLTEWVRQGWLVVSDPSRKKRSYELSALYRRYVGNPTAPNG